MSETWEQWYHGVDNSGDVTLWENIEGLRVMVKREMGEVHLVREGGKEGGSEGGRGREGGREARRGAVNFLSLTVLLLVAKVTADGGINCVDNPGEQEEISAQLLLCEVVTSLLLLKTNGALVLKTFTTLEHKTICLLYLLACCFAEVI